MKARRFVLILAASAPNQDYWAPVAAARLIWLLPSTWAGTLHRRAGRPAVVIETPEELSVDAVIVAGEAAFSDTRMRDWELAGCIPLPDTAGPLDECDPW